MNELNAITAIKGLLKIEKSEPDYLDKDITVWKLPDGTLHRKHGPAITYTNGTTKWYLNGKLHRDDGPAISLPENINFWFVNGIELTEEEFQKRSA